MRLQLIGDLDVPLELSSRITGHVDVHVRRRLPETDLKIQIVLCYFLINYNF